MNTTLYKLKTGGFNDRYAAFIPKTFQRKIFQCPVCQVRKFERIFPATVEQVGDTLGDFASGLGLTLCKINVAQSLCNRFKGLQTKKVYVQKKDRPQSETAAALPLPSDEVVELWLPFYLGEDLSTATLNIDTFCPACGNTFASIEGVELNPLQVKASNSEPLPRASGQGLHLNANLLKGHDAFRYGARNIVLACVRDYVVEQALTNVDFINYGEVTDYESLPSSRFSTE